MWNDAPITALADDRLDRAPYARIIANLIDEGHSWDDSIVFGLTGPWGSGKTSMLGMVEEALGERGRNPAWRVAHFTPWATGDVDGLLGDFYSSLAEAMPTVRGHDRLRKALGTLAQVTAPAAKAIPWAGEAIAEAAGTTGRALASRPSWDHAFKKATAEFKDQLTPILVVADDIDRLQPDELLALLKVVRLLGRFPGVNYLLAYDEETLFNTLAGTNTVSDGEIAGKFMEKIVQYPLFIPPLSVRRLTEFLVSGLSGSANSIDFDMESVPFGGLSSVCLPFLQTPRSIERFLAQVRHRAKMYAHTNTELEVVVAMTLLRSTFPALYQQLPMSRDLLANKPVLMGIGPDEDVLESGRAEIASLIDRNVSSRSQNAARALMYYLFPLYHPSRGPRDRSTTSARLCDERVFDISLSM
jgi:predicted KAP-like P-loop ATPase